MPIYEYECAKCHEITEVMQKMSDPGPAKCPVCGGTKLQRVMSQTSFQLKGEGWYITDYSRKDKESKAAGSKKKDEGASTESAPAEKEIARGPSASRVAKKKTGLKSAALKPLKAVVAMTAVAKAAAVKKAVAKKAAVSRTTAKNNAVKKNAVKKPVAAKKPVKKAVKKKR